MHSGTRILGTLFLFLVVFGSTAGLTIKFLSDSDRRTQELAKRLMLLALAGDLERNQMTEQLILEEGGLRPELKKAEAGHSASLKTIQIMTEMGIMRRGLTTPDAELSSLYEALTDNRKQMAAAVYDFTRAATALRNSVSGSLMDLTDVDEVVFTSRRRSAEHLFGKPSSGGEARPRADLTAEAIQRGYENIAAVNRLDKWQMWLGADLRRSFWDEDPSRIVTLAADGAEIKDLLTGLKETPGLTEAERRRIEALPPIIDGLGDKSERLLSEMRAKAQSRDEFERLSQEGLSLSGRLRNMLLARSLALNEERIRPADTVLRILMTAVLAGLLVFIIHQLFSGRGRGAKGGRPEAEVIDLLKPKKALEYRRLN